MSSFRVSATDILIKTDSNVSQAIIRGEVVSDSRKILLEAAIRQSGRSHFQVNRQRINRSDLLGLIPISVFVPDDLVIIKGGPNERRRYLDNTLIQIDPSLNNVRSDIENILRQRNALLRQSRGKLDVGIITTLDVWDDKFVIAAEKLARARRSLVEKLKSKVAESYTKISGKSPLIEMNYKSTWPPGELREILYKVRQEDLARGISTVGPHRDDLLIYLNGIPARTHASQGEQRLLILAMRLAAHRELAEITKQSPVLLLDDVLSEFDSNISQGVLTTLEAEQTFLTTAGELPTGIVCSTRFQVSNGEVNILS